MEFFPYDYMWPMFILAGILLIYSWVDNKHPWYANITASLLSTSVFGLLALAIVNGSMKMFDGGELVAVQNVALSYFFIFCAIIAAGYTGLQIVLVFLEKTGKRGAEE